ncbi:hypothetical protein BJV78DRAFT_560692 [Lactifluus subvellereus]|nr:hypothetical protein BJV78DRAFT_560692 [Lactifluus subvellereus]
MMRYMPHRCSAHRIAEPSVSGVFAQSFTATGAPRSGCSQSDRKRRLRSLRMLLLQHVPPGEPEHRHRLMSAHWRRRRRFHCSKRTNERHRVCVARGARSRAGYYSRPKGEKRDHLWGTGVSPGSQDGKHSTRGELTCKPPGGGARAKLGRETRHRRHSSESESSLPLLQAPEQRPDARFHSTVIVSHSPHSPHLSPTSNRCSPSLALAAGSVLGSLLRGDWSYREERRLSHVGR